MAELLAANQITIAKVLDGEMSAEQLAQLNQASEDASQAKSDVDNLEVGGRNLLQLRNWGRYYNSIWWADIVNVTNDGYTFTAIGSPCDLIGFKVPVESGVITISGKTGLVSQTIYFTVYGSSGDKVQAQRYVNVTTQNGRFVLMLTMPSGASELHIGFGYYPYSSASGDYTVSNLKIEKGNKATDWTPAPEDVDAGIDNAAKVATNYIHYDSTDGLVLGNKESGSWVGYRTQIDNDSFNVLDENGNIIASYGSNEVELGKGNPSAIIKMCDGKAYVKNYVVGSQNTSVFCGQDVTVVGEWEGASEAYALFKQGFINIAQASSHIKFFNEHDNMNQVEIQGQNITMRRVTNVGDFNCYMDANFKCSVTIATPLPISSGGTGATTAAAARANLGLVGVETRTLLWTNASPTSEFANQTLSLSLSEYDAVEIECCYGSSYTNIVETGIYKKSYTKQYMTCHGDIKTNNTGFYISQRLVTVTASGITFGKGMYKNVSGAVKGAEGNTYCVPLKIYGIKGV